MIFCFWLLTTSRKTIDTLIITEAINNLIYFFSLNKNIRQNTLDKYFELQFIDDKYCCNSLINKGQFYSFKCFLF